MEQKDFPKIQHFLDNTSAKNLEKLSKKEIKRKREKDRYHEKKAKLVNTSVKNDQKQMFSCQFCSKQCEWKKSVVRHELIHHKNEKDYEEKRTKMNFNWGGMYYIHSQEKVLAH